MVITTIVSSPMLGGIEKDLGAAYAETLTGFKWIANRALAAEASGEATFVFGYEEALGSSVGGGLYAADRLHTIGVVGAIFVAASLAIVFATRPRSAVAA